MIDWAKRLRDRMAYLGLNSTETARRVGANYKTFNHYLTGRAKRGLVTAQFLRMLKVVEATPNQVYGLEPLAGTDPVVPEPRDPHFDRLLAHANILTPRNLAMAADLVAAVARRQVEEEGCPFEDGDRKSAKGDE